MEIQIVIMTIFLKALHTGGTALIVIDPSLL